MDLRFEYKLIVLAALSMLLMPSPSFSQSTKPGSNSRLPADSPENHNYQAKSLGDAAVAKGTKSKSGATLLGWPELRTFDSAAKEIPAELKNWLGKSVAVKGYALPLDSLEKVKELLLLPYPVACVHVPPPPANQMVRVELAEGFPFKDLGGIYEVTGELKIIPSSGDFSPTFELLKAKMVAADGK